MCDHGAWLAFAPVCEFGFEMTAYLIMTKAVFFFLIEANHPCDEYAGEVQGTEPRKGALQQTI